MCANKTQPTRASVAQWLAGIASTEQRTDCELLLTMMIELTGHKPALWGDSLIGFGQYHYRYESGREGDFFRTGFACRKSGLSVYLMACGSHQSVLLKDLGKHKMGKSCLNIKRLSDVNITVLRALLVESLEEMARRYPQD